MLFDFRVINQHLQNRKSATELSKENRSSASRAAEFEMNGNAINIAFSRYYRSPGSQMCVGPSVMIWYFDPKATRCLQVKLKWEP